MPGATDGEYPLAVGRAAAKPWTAFCKDMAGMPSKLVQLVYAP
jgi:hypothetical protein